MNEYEKTQIWTHLLKGFFCTSPFSRQKKVDFFFQTLFTNPYAVHGGHGIYAYSFFRAHSQLRKVSLLFFLSLFSQIQVIQRTCSLTYFLIKSTGLKHLMCCAKRAGLDSIYILLHTYMHAYAHTTSENLNKPTRS